MHIHKNHQEVKASGYIRKKGLEAYEITIKYGQYNTMNDHWKEIIHAKLNSEIDDTFQRTTDISKLMNHTQLLTDQTVTTIIKKFHEYDEKEFEEALYTISPENKLSMSPIKKHTQLKITSFYATSKNPKIAKKKEKPRLLTLRDIKKIKKKKIEHPRITYYDYSHIKTPAHHKAGISLLDGKKLAENIANIYGTQNFESALLNYIIHDLKIDKTQPIIYQSICVPNTHHMNLSRHGAQYILTNPEFFYQETHTLLRLQRDYGYQKIKFCIPNIKTAEEVEGIKRLLRRKQITRSHAFQLLITVEVPSAIFTLEAILSVGVDGVVCNVHKLAQYILALDTHLYEKKKYIHDAAVKSAISAIMQTTARWHIPCFLLITEEDEKFIETIPNLKHVNIVVPYVEE